MREERKMSTSNSNETQHNTSFGVEYFKDIDGIRALFQSVNCIGNDNCFLVAYNRDYLPNGETNLNVAATIAGVKQGGIVGGIVGGMAANAVTNAFNEMQKNFMDSLDDSLKVILNTSKYCGFLLNKTEAGIGFIPLINDYKLIVKVEDFKTELENYVFIRNEDIKGIELKKLALNFGKRILKITFNLSNNPSTFWTLPMDHKLISYQAESFEKFCKSI